MDIIEDGSKHTLILYNCSVPMTGEVAYTAANARCSAKLKVKGKPASSSQQPQNRCETTSSLAELPLNFLTSLNDVQVYEKDEARFEVELSRAPKSFRWLKGSQELQSDDKYELIQEGHTYVLLIRSAVYEDEAKYMFEAEDKRTSCKLVLQGSKKRKQMTFVMCTVSRILDHPNRLVGFQNLICPLFLWQESVWSLSDRLKT